MAVGTSIPHESARAHVTGSALYTDDLASRFTNLLHAWPVCAAEAHARVLHIDHRAARALPGVVDVLTASDVPGDNEIGPARRDEPLFPDVVHYFGQPIAWVLGETEEAAKQGALQVKVEYEALPPLRSLKEAIASESFHTAPAVIRCGHPEKVLSAADTVVEGEVHIGGQEHFYLETQAAIADRDESGHFVVHSSTQHPTETQEICARVLGISRAEVTCQSLRMGGAFGGKEVQANAYAAVAVVGAHKMGRPVRVRLDRQRDMVITGKRHPFLGRYRAAFTDDGSLEAVEIDLFSDGGFSLDLSKPVLYRAMFHVDNAYCLRNARVTGRVCHTHRTSQTAFRGFGGPQGMVVIEEILDHGARMLGLAPHVVREKNLYREGDRAHYGQPIKDAGRIGRIWSELKESSDFQDRWDAVEHFNAAEPDRKRGLAMTPVKFGISFTTAFFNQAGALVLVYRDGSVQVNHGGTEMGQGLHTKIQQIAAKNLGLPLEAIRIMPTRTDKVPNTSATAASSGTDLNGAAVKHACDQIRERLADVAGRMLGVVPGDLVFENGEVFPFYDRDKSATFADVANAGYLARVPLFASGYYRTPKIHFDEAKGRGKPFHYYAYGAAVAEVEVDGFTGMYSLRRVDILHDCGESISPLVDRGQVEGGFAQGVGWLTTEELKWSDDGQLATRGASTYKLPTLGECPPVFRVTLLPKAPEPTVIHGSKAVGEPPLMLAMSVREALRQAVSAFGSQNRVVLGCPSTPEQVFWAVERARSPEVLDSVEGRAAE
ncbi:MAG: xanthine dehydrogenase molybdopterin binding subunit [Myxococcota bacterium]